MAHVVRVARRVIANTVLASACIAVTFVLVFRLHNSQNALGNLVSAVGSTLDIEPRLTGGFAPPAASAATRSAAARAERLAPDVRIAIARIEKLAAGSRRPEYLSSLGVAFLVAGNVDGAISTLEEATSLVGSAASWSDLSAAYLVKADRVPARRIEYLARALEAASRSIRTRVSNEARFNRALAMSGLSPFVGAPAPWADYLSHERDSRWIDHVQRYLHRDGTVPELRRQWDDRRAALRERLHARDTEFVADTVSAFPEATLEFFEVELLGGWARAAIAGDASTARVELALARLLAEAFVAQHDQLPHDAVRAIDAASPPQNLARAHIDYVNGVDRYRADDYKTALTAFEAAQVAFARHRSPYRDWSTLQIATILFQQRRLDESDQRLAAVEQQAWRFSYPTLLGRTLKQRGLTQSKQWRITEALDSFERAAACFETAGQRESAVNVYSQIADALRTLGEHQRSWEYIAKTLDGLESVRTPLRRYLLLFNASLFASRQDLLEAALLFQDAAVREAAERGGGPLVEALTQRATIHSRRRDAPSARRDLADAEALLAKLPAEHPLRRYHRAQIDVVSAELGPSGPSDPRAPAVEDAIRFFSEAEPALVPRLHLILGRAYLASGAIEEAEHAFERGIAWLEGQHERLADDDFRMSYFDESWDLFPEMIALQANVRRDLDRAFMYSERSRARTLLATARNADTKPMTLEQIQRSVPESVAILYYVMLPDRLLIWSLTRYTHHLFETRVRRDELIRRLIRLRTEIVEADVGARTDGEALFDWLVRPAFSTIPRGATLVVVPDSELQQLPFAALHNVDTGRYLVEDFPILSSPSATLFARPASSLADRQERGLESALLVGNPAAGKSALLALPGAEEEVAAAARIYPRRTLLFGSSATKTRFVEAAPDYDVVHFGGHAIANVEYPTFSRLSFAPEGGSVEAQPLFAHEIARMRFHRTRLVVLAACSTATGTVSRGEGVISVARPFLAAGVPLVIASQWDVDDRSTRELFVVFHTALAQTHDPVTALQTAQLSLIRGGQSSASARTWSAFVALGTTAH